MEFSLSDFFCGPGGLVFGAMSARPATRALDIEIFSIIHGWASDYDHEICNTYVSCLATLQTLKVEE